MSRLMSILHFYINVPIRCLAGKTHTFSAREWYVKSMGRAIDYLYVFMLKLEKYGWEILDEKFMFNISKPLKLKPFDNYFKYIFDLKITLTVSNTGQKSLESKSKRNCSTQPAKRIKQCRCLWSN